MKTLSIRNEMRRLGFENGEMTQKDPAAKGGVTRQTSMAIENARYSPTLELAFKIAEVFGVDVGSVFSYDPP